VEIISLEQRSARVVVPDFQLSLAIGKEGQNARLAARLTGWRIDIRSDEGPGLASTTHGDPVHTSAGTRWSSPPSDHSGKSNTATITCSGYAGGAAQRRTSLPSTVKTASVRSQSTA
jgi:hypothetical protein